MVAHSDLGKNTEYYGLVAGPTEKMTLLQSVTDALDIALTKVSHALILFAGFKCAP